MRTGWRRATAFAAGGVVLAAAAAGIGIAVADGGGDPGVAPTPSPSGAAVVSGPAAAGGTCGWQQEGDAARDGGGQALRCVRTANGYHWQLS